MTFRDLLQAMARRADAMQSPVVREWATVTLQQLEARKAPVLALEMQLDRLKIKEERR
jgi:hypothetical protein